MIIRCQDNLHWINHRFTAAVVTTEERFEDILAIDSSVLVKRRNWDPQYLNEKCDPNLKMRIPSIYVAETETENCNNTETCTNLVKTKIMFESPFETNSMSDSVSYTHLDVYKRQRLTGNAYI